MASTVIGSSTSRGKCYKNGSGDKATRRSWSPKEEAFLLAAMKDLVAGGWKSDNGFRGGFINRLEDTLGKEFPGADIKAVPHINSKIQNWKKNYNSLNGMLSRSGVGWNGNGTHTIDCNDEQWDQIVKCDSNARGKRHRPWPLFTDWQFIFGKDRATGDNAEDVLDAVNKMMDEEMLNDTGKDLDGNEVCMEDVSVNDVGENSSSKSVKEQVVNKKQVSGKKRKSSGDSLQIALEMFCEISRGTNAHLEMVANRIGYDFDVDQAKKDAFAMLEGIPGLSLDDKFDVCKIFADQNNRRLVFQGLPEDARKKYVDRLLKSKK